MLSAAKFLCRATKNPRTLRLCSAAVKDRELIGCREVVCAGMNNKPIYYDRPDYPCPAIRFLADNPYLQALREKERGDWKSLTIDEKKCLYRASFCQTFAEMMAPTGEWKSIVGCTLFFITLSIWMSIAVKNLCLPPLPESVSEERQQAQLERMINMQVNPIEGLASKWDYDKGDWKESRWFWE